MLTLIDQVSKYRHNGTRNARYKCQFNMEEEEEEEGDNGTIKSDKIKSEWGDDATSELHYAPTRKAEKKTNGENSESYLSFRNAQSRKETEQLPSPLTPHPTPVPPHSPSAAGKLKANRFLILF